MAEQAVGLDYGFCLEETLGRGQGLSLSWLKELAPKVAELHQRLEGQRRAGELGFYALPTMPAAQRRAIEDEASRLAGLADTLVVLGIGGSALGTTCVDMALTGALRHAFPPADRHRLIVADNSDPRLFGQILAGMDPGRTAFNVVSKSGSTAETMSQYLVIKERLARDLGQEEARARLVFTTDPSEGILRPLSQSEGIAALPVPPNVGGRYSVLSAVGLLPLAFAGHDIKALLAGAAEMASRCSSPELMENPAYLFAALAFGMWQQGRNVLVMMPYSSDLFGLAQWFGQLWAESLGKAQALDGRPLNVGQTPVAAVGATDQHSQLQLYMEGPQDKLLAFVTLADYGRPLAIPDLYPDQPALAYLGGRRMEELIAAEARATAVALALSGRPSLSLRLPRISEHALGQVIFLLEAATVMAGALLNINPLDQPGVELSKQLTYGLMGRQGYDQERRRIEALDSGERYLL